jgi:hypothetical protein
MISGVEQVGFESAQEIIASLSKGKGNPRECRWSVCNRRSWAQVRMFL